MTGKRDNDTDEHSEPARQLFGQKGGASPWDGTLKRKDDAPAPDTSSAPYPEGGDALPYIAPAPSEAEPQIEGELTQLHPNFRLLMRIGAIVMAAVLTGAAFALEKALQTEFEFASGLIFIPVAVLGLLYAIRIPSARYNSRGFEMSADRLRVVKGVMFHADTVVPFGRVQHIDVEQGPFERALNIATLTLHTAGSHNASVHLPGLEHSLAVEMREEIRAHIKKESL